MTPGVGRALGVFVAGFVMLVLFGVGAVVLDDYGAELEARGTRVEGVVLAVQGGGRNPWTADVRYHAAGQSREEQISLGDNGSTTRTGDRITLVYDPADPERVAVPGVHSDPVWAVWLMIALALGAGAGLVSGPVLLYRALVLRRRAT